jgi:hypothetical protein
MGRKEGTKAVRRALERLQRARFAPALSLPEAAAQILARHGVDLSRARARAGFSRGHLLDVVVYVPGGLGDVHEREAAQDFVQLLVGEELFERWVGTVSVTPGARTGPLAVINANSEEHSALPISSLLEAVRAAVAGLKLGLPGEPLASHSEAEDWVLFELSPEPAPDYAAQDDLVLLSTRLPELKKSFLRGEPFFSGRFSNFGELFTYLKYESAPLSSDARLAERAALESELLRVLRPEDGALVGLGLGVRYGYLDLALAEPECVEGRLLPALCAAGIAKRAWLLFCDSELEREWIPVHADAPAPFFG